MLKSTAKSCKIQRKTGEKTGEHEGMSGRRMQSRADNARKDADGSAKCKNTPAEGGRKNIPILRILGLAR